MYGEIQQRERMHESYLFDVDRLTIRMAGGETIERDVVCTRGAALVLPVLDDGGIVLIRNYRYAHCRHLWELPCGTLENNETPADCAARELKEEAGYTAEHIEPLGECYSSPGLMDEVIYTYLATGLTAGEQALDVYEDIEVKILPDAEVRRMVADGEIVDGKTITALAQYWMRPA